MTTLRRNAIYQGDLYPIYSKQEGIEQLMKTPPSPFTVQDSGERQEFSSGMVRDTAKGKMRPDLVMDGPLFLRWVRLMTKGAEKYEARNWMKATSQEEGNRGLESAMRHFTIWYTWHKYGLNIEDLDNPTTEPLTEDHAAAVPFNINLVEYVAERL